MSGEHLQLQGSRAKDLIIEELNGTDEYIDVYLSIQ